MEPYLHGRLLAVMGASGSGKDTLISGIQRRAPLLVRINSETSRPPRTGDTSYKYATEEQMCECNALGEYAWMIGAHGAYYATYADDLEEALCYPHGSIIDITPETLSKLIGWLTPKGKLSSLLPIFLEADFKQLESNLWQRGLAGMLSQGQESLDFDWSGSTRKLARTVNQRLTDCRNYPQQMRQLAEHYNITYQPIINNDSREELVEKAWNYIQELLPALVATPS